LGPTECQKKAEENNLGFYLSKIVLTNIIKNAMMWLDKEHWQLNEVRRKQ
jgi:hypothetical protein